MSCVAEANAISQKRASVAWKKPDAGSANAIDAMAMAIAHCMARTHQRLLRIMSTKGLQNGLITHGR